MSTDNPYAPENRPKIREGDLTFIWRTNAQVDQLELKPDSDAITYTPRGGGRPLELSHARLGIPYATEMNSSPALAAQGFVGVYELTP
jgi:hypothetical protein